MALDETIPVDGDGETYGVLVCELAEAIRTLRTDLNDGDLDTLANIVNVVGTDVGIGIATPEKQVHIFRNAADFALYVENNGESGSGIRIDAGTNITSYPLYIFDDDAANTFFVVNGVGNVGIGVSPTLLLDVKAKSGMTAIGGICIKLTNKTGANSVAGGLLIADTTTNDAVDLSAADEEQPLGVFLESGIADGSEAWVVVSGIADVAMEDNTAATRGYWVRSSITESGYADATNAAPPAPASFVHFTEVGHCIESVAAGGGGTHILARCVLHFN